MRRPRAPQPCSSAPPSVLAKVTFTQSRRAGAPLVSAYTPSAASASSAQLASTATMAFSRRPQRSGSDSRRCCSNMIMRAEGYSGGPAPGTPRAGMARPAGYSAESPAGSNASAAELMQ